jgi:hypothetical protein
MGRRWDASDPEADQKAGAPGRHPALAYNLSMSSVVSRWLPVALWVTVIYTTIGFVRHLREWYVARWDTTFIGWAVAAVLVAGAAAAAVVVRHRVRQLRPGAMVWLAGLTLVLVVWTFSLRRSPEEAVHFIEYGALALLLHRALRPVVPGPSVFVAGALAGALVGTTDEIIQWFSPSRYWDWRDIVLNAGAGGVVQLAVWRVLPERADPKPPRSIRIVLRLAAAQLLLLTLCLANTPDRVARYAPALPGLDHFTNPDNPMAEYGHLHRIPGLGSFKSRLGLSELADQDRQRAAEVARLVDDARHRYGVFLRTWPVTEDPFTYEMRVHLFARNRNLAKARERGLDGPVAIEQLTTSWNENRLVESFFGRSLAQSSYVWPVELRQRLESRRDPDMVFRSAAASHLICFASESTLRLILLTMVAVCIAADLRIRSTEGRRP